MLDEAPQIARWLVDFLRIESYPAPVTVGSYAYADGEAHVRLAVAMDAIGLALAEERGAGAVNLAFLCSPIDVFSVRKETRDFSNELYDKEYATPGNLLGYWLTPFLPDRVLVQQYRGAGVVPVGVGGSKSKSGEQYYICDVALHQQGPNYMLAKRMQQWRAVVARKGGSLVSSNVAPSSRTASVMSNALFAAGYSGAGILSPALEIFDADTSNTLMTLLMLHDIQNTDTASNPSLPGASLDTPLALFTYGSVHG